MNILNYGECIRSGNYKLHSKFKSVHNYTNDQELISLVSTEVGSGPNNIVLNKIPKSAEEILLITSQTLSIGNTALHFDPDEICIEDDYYIEDTSVILARIKRLWDNIKNEFLPKSLAFLLFPENEKFFQTSFEKAFLAHVKDTVQNITLDSFPIIIKNMKGVGFGLTPSGDDFNCGVLYALNYLDKSTGNDFSGIIKECYHNSIGNNLISNTFLKYAYLNKYYENFYELLKALKKNNKVSHYANKIVSSGHTSGSDMLTGFILTIKNLTQNNVDLI